MVRFGKHDTITELRNLQVSFVVSICRHHFSHSIPSALPIFATFFLATILIWYPIRFAKMELCGRSTIFSTTENWNELFSSPIGPWSEYFFGYLQFIWKRLLGFTPLLFFSPMHTLDADNSIDFAMDWTRYQKSAHFS